MVTPLQLAIVFPGDAETRRAATPSNNRFAALFSAFAARGVDARPAVYVPAEPGALREQLLAVDGALVWVNPIVDGQARAPLDALLGEVAAAGVFVSTHPDVILKLGTKDVLVDTRDMGWGSDAHRLDTLAQLRAELGSRLRSGEARVLKQWRGHSGIGVWRVERVEPAARDVPAAAGELFRVREATRGSFEREVTYDELVELMAPYFAAGGHMVDQAWQPRMVDGMVRCYLVRDRVVGFGLQAVNALHPGRGGSAPSAAPTPSTRLYHPPDLAHLQGLKHRIEAEWVPELQQRLDIATDQLPLLWDCDFLRAESATADTEAFVLCEINVSSVAPFPDSAIEPLVEATVARLEARRRSR